MTPDDEERFWVKVKKRKDGCWEWQAYRGPCGYGRFNLLENGVKAHRYAHRLSYALEHGSITRGQHVLHKCDNPACVNPEHLFLGDQKSNMADRDAKGRQAKGTKNGRCKLTEKQVLEIYRRAWEGELRAVLAEEFGVAKGTIRDIKLGRIWGHLTGQAKPTYYVKS